MSDETDELEMSIQELTPPSVDARLWRVQVVRKAITFQVAATGRSFTETPVGSKSVGRLWSDSEIAKGIRSAVRRALVSPPRKDRGMTYWIDVTSSDFYEANGKLAAGQ